MVSNIPNPIHLWWVRKQVPAESDVPSPGFEDVPAGHANAGDIDCIAYCGITKGTGDGTTYSPSMSVNCEHMALFLTRLAGLVGIKVRPPIPHISPPILPPPLGDP